MRKPELVAGRCGYCFRTSTDVVKTILRATPKEGFNSSEILLCPNCRKYLNGSWKRIND